MKKKLLALIFGTLLTLQSNMLTPVNAVGDNYTTKTPRLKPKPFNLTVIKPIEEDLTQDDTAEDVESPTHFLSFCSFVAGKNNIQSIIQSRIHDNHIYAYIDKSTSPNKTWVIFHTSSGIYICYQPDSLPKDDRKRIIMDVIRHQNTQITTIREFLLSAKNVILYLTTEL